jgi:hypothetical protein
LAPYILFPSPHFQDSQLPGASFPPGKESLFKKDAETLITTMPHFRKVDESDFAHFKPLIILLLRNLFQHCLFRRESLSGLPASGKSFTSGLHLFLLWNGFGSVRAIIRGYYGLLPFFSISTTRSSACPGASFPQRKKEDLRWGSYKSSSAKSRNSTIARTHLPTYHPFRKVVESEFPHSRRYPGLNLSQVISGPAGHRVATLPRPIANLFHPDCICLVLLGDGFGPISAIIRAHYGGLLPSYSIFTIY